METSRCLVRYMLAANLRPGIRLSPLGNRKSTHEEEQRLEDQNHSERNHSTNNTSHGFGHSGAAGRLDRRSRTLAVGVPASLAPLMLSSNGDLLGLLDKVSPWEDDAGLPEQRILIRCRGSADGPVVEDKPHADFRLSRECVRGRVGH